VRCEPGYIYSRVSNRRWRLFEARMCAGSKARKRRAPPPPAWRGNRFASVASSGRATSGGGAGDYSDSCRYVIEDCFAAFRHPIDPRRGHLTSSPREAAVADGDESLLSSAKPTNPTLEIIDIARVAKLASSGARLVVDNVFATLAQSPFERRTMSSSIRHQAHRRRRTLSRRGESWHSEEIRADHCTRFLARLLPQASRATLNLFPTTCGPCSNGYF